MSDGFNLSDWALKHRSLVWFAIVALAVAGFGSYFALGRAEDPSFTVKTMVVQVAWPGASITDTIEQVTDRIEKKLQETPTLDYLKSYTTAGQTTIFVNLTGATPGTAVPGIWDDVRDDINDIRATLPDGIQGPFFNTKFGDTYAIIYAFLGDGFTFREVRDYAEDVRSRLLAVPDVAKVDLIGAQDEKIYVEFSPDRLAELNLNPQSLASALQAQNAVTPAGTVQTADEKILIEVSGSFQSEADLEKVNFVVDGQLLRLRDIATVRRGFADPPQPMFRFNGKPALGLGITMREGGDNLALGENVEHAMEEILADLPIGIEPQLVAEQPKVVEAAIEEFTKALWEAIAIVLAVSFLSLGLRAGAVVACSIPLVLAAVFVVMEYMAIDLQRVSLGALIIALGLLVDDAMITVEMMVSRLEMGWNKVRAATFAYTSTAFPMLTGTIVTVAAFVPIGFAKSSAGEYTYSMFAVVAVALLISWVVAVLFAPAIADVILPAELKHKESHGPGPILRRFRSFLVLAMRARWVTVGLTLAALALSIFGLNFIPQQFFPASDRPELMVDLKLPQGSSIYATERTAASFDEVLAGDPDIVHWTTYVGRGAVRFFLGLNVQLNNDFFAQSVIVARDLDARDRLKERLEPIIAERYPDVVARLSPLELGPPVGWPVQYRVSGPDPQRVRDIAYQVAGILADSPFSDQINFDWIEPLRTLRVRVDQDQVRLLGVSSQAVAEALNAVVSGITVTQVRDGIYLIDVVARAVEDERISPTRLGTLGIRLPTGATVPLAQLATIEYGQDFPLIWRRDRLPTLTVQADVTGGVLPDQVVSELQPKIDTLDASLPAGYFIEAGGSAEASAESMASLAAALPAAALLILIVLMIQLQSFQRMFLVLSVAPFGLIGVVLALLIFQKPLGFVAMLGVIALVGMIVRNSVILVDQIEVERAAGRAPWDAVVEATVHRFRPILLTAAAAILGMIPIAPTVFWGPMAYAIMGGLAVATALTLVFLPALYVIWFRIKETGDAETSPTTAHATAPAAG